MEEEEEEEAAANFSPTPRANAVRYSTGHGHRSANRYLSIKSVNATVSGCRYASRCRLANLSTSAGDPVMASKAKYRCQTSKAPKESDALGIATPAAAAAAATCAACAAADVADPEEDDDDEEEEEVDAVLVAMPVVVTSPPNVSKAFSATARKF